MTNIEQYINNNSCVTLPKRVPIYLQKDNFLSEFETDEEKLLAMLNLLLLDKVPTEDSTRLINSGDLYLLFKNIKLLIDNMNLTDYYDKTTIDELLNSIYELLNTKANIDELPEIAKTGNYNDLEDKPDMSLYYTILEINNLILSENKFLYYETQAAFEADLSNIADTSIVFVKENRRIYTHGAEYGSNIKNELGEDPNAAVSLKTITEALNAIWEKINSITGESSRRLVMTISPKRYFSGESCIAHITVITQSSTFEEVTLYVNDAVVAHGAGQNIFEWDIELTGDSTIVCKARILGEEYEVRDKIYNRYTFYIGAGTSYEDILDELHLIASAEIHTTVDVTFNNNDHLYVVIESGMLDSFIRADMNGFEIPFLMLGQNIVIDGVLCTVLQSENTYKAGTYNIDING